MLAASGIDFPFCISGSTSLRLFRFFTGYACVFFLYLADSGLSTVQSFLVRLSKLPLFISMLLNISAFFSSTISYWLSEIFGLLLAWSSTLGSIAYTSSFSFRLMACYLCSLSIAFCRISFSFGTFLFSRCLISRPMITFLSLCERREARWAISPVMISPEGSSMRSCT